MSAPDAVSDKHAAKPPARPRRRNLAPILRLVLPAFAGALALVVVGWTIATALRAPHDVATPPLEVVSPRVIGRDDKGRAFVVTADRASRQPGATQRVDLQTPVLVRDEGGPDALRVLAPRGVYDEATARLTLSGGVKVDGARGRFSAPSIVYDTRTGRLVTGSVRSQDANGVHARLNTR